MALEQEVKLPFVTIEAARLALETAGARLVFSRRLLDDQLFDTPEGQLRQAGSALRIRQAGEQVWLTWKGPVQAGPVKAREELETSVGDAATIRAVLISLGYRPRFRSQKYREDYLLDTAVVVIDDTPLGVFVEIEAAPAVIEHVAAKLGRTPADYRLESYATLWRQWCDARGRPFGDMLFE